MNPKYPPMNKRNNYSTTIVPSQALVFSVTVIGAAGSHWIGRSELSITWNRLSRRAGLSRRRRRVGHAGLRRWKCLYNISIFRMWIVRRDAIEGFLGKELGCTAGTARFAMNGL
jgi:hypothetical protein